MCGLALRLHLSNGKASPARIMKPTCAVLAMVTHLSWMANVRTSLHCTSPGVEHERMNITFRWVKQHVSSCAQGSSVLVTGIVGNGGFWASPWCFVHMEWC